MKRSTTLVLAILLVLGLTAWLLWSEPAPVVSGVPSRFLEFDPAEITVLESKTAAGEIRLERDAKDPDRWRVAVEGALVRADADRVEDLVLGLSRIAPRTRWGKEEIDPGEREKWGLTEPLATVRLERRSGEPLRADFGRRTTEGSHVYAERNRDGGAWVVPADELRTLEGARSESLREKRPAGGTSFDLKEVAVTRADGLRFAAVRESGGTWRVTAPYEGAADPDGIESLVAKIVNVEVVEYVADGTVDLDRYGLVEPRATVALRREGEEREQVLRFGDRVSEGGNGWFMEEGEPSVYACSKDLPNALEKLDPSALRDRNALRLGWTKLDAVAFHRREVEWKLLRVLDRWDVEHPERVPADSTAADAFLERLRTLEASAFLDGEDPAALGLATEEGAPARLVLTGTDEAGNRRLLLGEKREDGLVPARLLPPKGAEAGPGVLMLLPGEFLDRLDEGWLSFRDREVMKVDLAEVRALSRSRGGETETWRREKGAWKGPEGGPEPDGEALTRALSRLLTVRCVRFVGKADEATLARTGLGPGGPGPALALELGKEGQERTETLVLGKATEDGTGHYARKGRGDLVFVLEDRIVQGAEILPFHDSLVAPFAKGEAAPADGPAEEAPAKDPEGPPPAGDGDRDGDAEDGGG